MEKQGFYVGIDIDDRNAVVSFYEEGMKEPATFSMVAGSEIFQIPVLITKKHGMGQWFVGEEAAKTAQAGQGDMVDYLIDRSLRQEEIMFEGQAYQARELLILFLKKIIAYAGGISQMAEPEICAVSVPQLSPELAKFFAELGEDLGYEKNRWLVMDRKDAFYHFTLNQPKELWLHEVCLFDCRKTELKCFSLKRNQNTMPQLITISEESFTLEETEKDEAFYQILENCFKGRVVSAVYLVGDGFDGDWMKLSTAYMCRGRRAFMGKNLYAKGACYAVLVHQKKPDWPFLYMGDNELKVNVSLKVSSHGKEMFHSLLLAGENWYEAEGICEVILTEGKELAVWLQLPNSKEAKVESIILSDLQEREKKMTRLRLMAKPVSDTQIQLRIKDLGFGEIVKTSDLNWEYIMSV